VKEKYDAGINSNQPCRVALALVALTSLLHALRAGAQFQNLGRSNQTEGSHQAVPDLTSAIFGTPGISYF
jgi:hypothetical protein